MSGLVLPAGTLVIADLHLDPLGGPRVDEFCDWLAGLRALPRLVILGDLSDTWIGPKQRHLTGGTRLIEALAACVRAGTPVDLVPGNRDFLMGADVEGWTGARVHPGGFTAEAAGQRALFIHGDELCTRDVAYQRYKRRIQSRPARALLPRLPLPILRRIAEGLRAASLRDVPRKQAAELSQSPEAVRALAQAQGADLVVAGHAHVWRDERLPDGPRWIVLDGWGGARDMLYIGADRLEGRFHRDSV